MARLIDANALKSEFEWLLSVVNLCNKDKIRDTIERIEKAPTVDAVEAVRCKDCKKGHPELAPNGGVWCAVWNHVFDDDGFCSKGERKDK